MDLVPSAVFRGEAAIDIGANLGMYLPSLSRAVGPAGRVYAFEPIPYTVATMRRVVRLLRLRNVEISAKGCGQTSGTMSLRVPLQDSGALMTGQAHTAARNDDRPGREHQVRWERTRTVQVDMVALDEHLPDLENVSLIKCDIEGAELHAFCGAARLIDRNHPTVICEINPWFLDGLGIALQQLVGFFVERDYVLYRYEDAVRQLVPITDLATVEEDNYVLVHPQRLSRLSSFLAVAPASSV